MTFTQIIAAFDTSAVDIIKGDMTDKKRQACEARFTKTLQNSGYVGTFTLQPILDKKGEPIVGALKLVSSDPDDARRATGELPLNLRRWTFTIPGVTHRKGDYANKGAARSAAEGLAQAVVFTEVTVTDGDTSVIYDVVPCTTDRIGMTHELKLRV